MKLTRRTALKAFFGALALPGAALAAGSPKLPESGEIWTIRALSGLPGEIHEIRTDMGNGVTEYAYVYQNSENTYYPLSQYGNVVQTWMEPALKQAVEVPTLAHTFRG